MIRCRRQQSHREQLHNCIAQVDSRRVGWLIVLAAIAGCERGPNTVPVSGKVSYNGTPLEFGSVMFQPPSGQPALGEIQSDGTFSLSTYRPGDGAVVGRHKVRIACYESQRRGAACPRARRPPCP